jgi:DNA-binding NarL/FixJ family response regulator
MYRGLDHPLQWGQRRRIEVVRRGGARTLSSAFGAHDGSMSTLDPQGVANRAALLAAIRAVASGGSMIDPKIVESLVSARTRAECSPLNELTPREHEVLNEIAQGKSNAAIGDALFLTKRAVEKHINSIFMKLGLADSEEVSKRVKAVPLLLAEEADQTTVRSHDHI